MIYTGMKVSVKNEDSCAVGALLSFYQKNGLKSVTVSQNLQREG